MKKVKCKYYPKAICLRDDTSKCEECPYYLLVKKDSKKTF